MVISLMLLPGSIQTHSTKRKGMKIWNRCQGEWLSFRLFPVMPRPARLFDLFESSYLTDPDRHKKWAFYQESALVQTETHLS
jgi:hypothetical protein